jgi:RHS repeat-associated protein
MADALHSVISRASYTSENLLKSISGGGSATLAYDPAMRLFQVARTSTTRFAYDGLDLIGEYSGTNALLRRYVHGPGTDEPLVQYEGTGTTDRRFLQADERGSITAISDSSGNLLTANSYDEYGIPGASNAGRFQYTGQTWLPEVGLYYYKARMYSPTLGRFMQPDPIGYAGDGPNLFAYTLNDPVNFTDPLGLRWVTACVDSGGPVSCGPHWVDDGSPLWNVGPNPRAPTDPAEAGADERPIFVTGKKPPKTQQPNSKRTRGQCALFVLREDGLALGLDAAGIAAEILLPEVPAVIAAGYVGVAVFGNSIAHNDPTGAAIAYGGRHAGMAEGFFKGNAKSFARGLSIIGLGASTIRDLVQAKDDYDHCMAGTEAP